MVGRFFDWLWPQTPWDASRCPRNTALGAIIGVVAGFLAGRWL